MSSRLAFDSWQLVFPVIGFVLFVGIFLVAAVRAWRIRRPKVNHLENLPLHDEHSRPASHVRPK